MKILNVKRIEYYIVVTDEEDYNTYRRKVYGDVDSWENLMGESWEPVYDYAEFEKLLQEYLEKKH